MTGDRIVILISSGSEWRAAEAFFPGESSPSPFGAWFTHPVAGHDVIFLRGGVGKVSAAASTQYVIDHFQPQQLLNLGTCGGYAGHVTRGEIILAEETIIYDIAEQMASAEEAIRFYSTRFDLAWLTPPFPHPVRRTCLVSADRDLMDEQMPELFARYGAIAGDWESGAIAWVAARNKVRCLILRGVTDLVGAGGDPKTDRLEIYRTNAKKVMQQLLEALPAWLSCAGL